MKQEIRENCYYLLDEDGKVLLKITSSDLPGNQVIIETEQEVYAGPVNLISFDTNPKK